MHFPGKLKDFSLQLVELKIYFGEIHQRRSPTEMRGGNFIVLLRFPFARDRMLEPLFGVSDLRKYSSVVVFGGKPHGLATGLTQALDAMAQPSHFALPHRSRFRENSVGLYEHGAARVQIDGSAKSFHDGSEVQQQIFKF